MGRQAQIFIAVLRSPVLRSLQVAFLLFSIAEWATWVAIVVYAYERGGAAEAGLFAFLALAPSLLVAPLAAVLGDRYPRAVVLALGYGFQGVAMIGVALALLTGAPLVVYVAAALCATSMTVVRPLQASLLPEIVETPDELTAANVASSTIESLGVLIGPAIAAVLIDASGPTAVYGVCGIGMAIAAAAIVPLARAEIEARRTSPAVVHEPLALGTIRSEIVGGLAAIGADRSLAAVVVIAAVGALVFGALDIFYAVLAIDVLDIGGAGVGLLSAATGLGAVVGSLASVGLVGRRELAAPLLVSTGLMGVGVVAVALVAAPIVAAALLAAAGAAYSVHYVIDTTLVQRLAPTASLTRVFGAVEAVAMGMGALGALAVPVLVDLAGASGALVIAGAVLPVVALLTAPLLRAADRALIVPERELAVLRAVPMFSPLSAPVIERLARSLVEVAFPAGARIIAEGEAGDRFYVITSGRVDVTIDGRTIRSQGPGDWFGEIALLRAIPRTATVTAIDDVEAFALDRDPFLEAVTGQPRSRAVAATVVDDRLAAGS